MIINTENMMDAFPIGCVVNVRYCEGDAFQHNFVGTIKLHENNRVIVSDQDGDCWEVEYNQLSYNTDNIMHQ